VRLTRDLLDAVYSKTNGFCWYCGTVIPPFSNWQVDHQTPRSRGGGDEIQNLFPACQPCNSLKSNRDLEGYRHSFKVKLENQFTGVLEFLHAVGERVDADWDDSNPEPVTPIRVMAYHLGVAALTATQLTVRFHGEKSDYQPELDLHPNCESEAVS
jgi:hypothetical protein